MRPEKEVSDPAPGRATSVSMRKLRHIKRPIEQRAFYGLGTFYFSCTGTGTGRCTQRARTALNELADPLGRQVGKQAHRGQGPRRRLGDLGAPQPSANDELPARNNCAGSGGPECRALAYLLQAGAMLVQVPPWSLMLEPQRHSFRPQTPGGVWSRGHSVNAFHAPTRFHPSRRSSFTFIQTHKNTHGG